MPETQHLPENKDVLKKNIRGVKAKTLANQKKDIYLNRIEVLEMENMEFIRLLKDEKQLNLDKERSLSTVSHDCRSPLTSIQLSASLIERYYDRLDRQKLFAHLEKIKLAVTELTDKLDELIVV